MFRPIIIGFLLTIGLVIQGRAESIKIGILQNLKLSSIELVVSNGEYELIGDNEQTGVLKKGDRIKLSTGSSLVSYTLNGVAKKSSQVTLNIAAKNSEFKVYYRGHHRGFQDNLILKEKDGYFVLINEINLDKYVSGVVQAEVGNKRPFEYYKVQSVISRTYALSNKSKHQTEGFHLCDGVHCQAFKGAVINNDSILLAAVQTSGYVLTDHNIDLISAVFHSNCGGQTVNSDLVWTHALPYLEGVKDSFCISMPNAHWTKSIPEKKWADYMDRKTDSDSILFLESFTPEKTEYFNAVDGGIKNTEIRKDWKLKSAWFTTCVEGDQVVFYGRGFGHGVGLCQEGAIRMAELGYTYSDILHFYYSDVHLIDLEFLDFFRD